MGKKPFLTLVLPHSLSIGQAEFFGCCKAMTGLCKNVFFIYHFCVPRYENCPQRFPSLRFFFKIQKLAIFGRSKPKVKMYFLATFVHLFVVIVILNIQVKDYFNRLSCLSLRVMWMCLTFHLNLLLSRHMENKDKYMLETLSTKILVFL